MIITVDFVFKFLNFFVLCGVVVYGMYRYGIIALLAMIRKEKQEDEGQQQKYAFVLERIEHLQHVSAKQEQQFEQMQQQFTLWQQAVELENQRKKVLLQACRLKLQEKQSIKIRNMQSSYRIQQEIPKILDQAAVQLQADFDKHSAKQKAYLEQLVVFVKERSA